MVHQSVAVEEDEEAVVDEWDQQALVEGRTHAQAARDFQLQVQALEVVTQHASPVSPKPTEHVWSKRSSTEREWEP